MRYLTLVPLMLLVGCVGVPIKQKFPDTPESLKQSCADLQTVPDNNTKLSEMMTVVTANYKEYHDCQIKVESWMEWYKTQKEITEN